MTNTSDDTPVPDPDNKDFYIAIVALPSVLASGLLIDSRVSYITEPLEYQAILGIGRNNFYQYGNGVFHSFWVVSQHQVSA